MESLGATLAAPKGYLAGLNELDILPMRLFKIVLTYLNTSIFISNVYVVSSHHPSRTCVLDATLRTFHASASPRKFGMYARPELPSGLYVSCRRLPRVQNVENTH